MRGQSCTSFRIGMQRQISGCFALGKAVLVPICPIHFAHSGLSAQWKRCPSWNLFSKRRGFNLNLSRFTPWPDGLRTSRFRLARVLRPVSVVSTSKTDHPCCLLCCLPLQREQASWTCVPLRAAKQAFFRSLSDAMVLFLAPNLRQTVSALCAPIFVVQGRLIPQQPRQWRKNCHSTTVRGSISSSTHHVAVGGQSIRIPRSWSCGPNPKPRHWSHCKRRSLRRRQLFSNRGEQYFFLPVRRISRRMRNRSLGRWSIST